MVKEKVFCENCRDDVEYVVTEKEMVGTIKGEDYCYMGKVARCKNCNGELYVEKINDENLESLYAEFRKKAGIIALDKVRQIPKKYAIGKRPLSLVLGWGEQTFTRYYDGDTPTKQYSETLIKVYESPEFYNELLEKNRGNLKSENAYRKSKAAVSAIIGNDEESKTKLDIAAEYLIYLCEDITPLALQKALYYVQGFYHAFYGSFMFSEDCQAWVHGPVYRGIYAKYKDYKFDPIQLDDGFDDSKLTDREKQVVESVAKNICCYSGKVLERFTHQEDPWINSRGELDSKEPSNNLMSKEEIGKYFSDIKIKYDMRNPNDIEKYAEDMFSR